VRILLADDHALVRSGIASLLVAHGIEVVGEAGDGLAALQEARKLKPDIILMDVHMPRCNGMESTSLIKTEMPDIKIIMLTISEEEENLFEAIKSGADGYLLKNMKADQFLDLLGGVTRGEAAISPVMAASMVAEFAKRATGQEGKARDQELTDREKEVLELVRMGDPNKDIASSLHITENTVKYHLRNIMDKLHLRNRAAVAAYAATKGVNSMPPNAK